MVGKVSGSVPFIESIFGKLMNPIFPSNVFLNCKSLWIDGCGVTVLKLI